MPTDQTSPRRLFTALLALAFSEGPARASHAPDRCDDTLSDVISPAELKALMSATSAC